jgi:hypothetical protein
MNVSSHRVGAEDYERLRSHALGGLVPQPPLLRTLDVLLHNGLAVWMNFGFSSSEPSQVLPAVCSLVAQDELVFLLAHMIEPLLFP